MFTPGSTLGPLTRRLGAGAALLALAAVARAQQGGIEVFAGETLFARGTRVSLTYIDQRNETLFRGSNEVSDPLDRRFVQQRGVLGIDHGLRRDLTLSVLAPWIALGLESEGSDPDGAGLGDVALLAKKQLYRHDWKRSGFFVAGVVGLELPTGSTNEREGASRLPPQLQPGAGAWSPFAALSGTLSLERWRFDAQLFHKSNQEGAQDFEQGDFTALTLDGAYRFLHTKYPGPTAGARIGLQWRHVGRAQQDDVRLPDSGSDELRGRAGLTWHPSPRWDITFGVELPIYQDQNGEQLGFDLRTVAAVGIRF